MMNEDKIYEHILEIKSSVASIDAKVDGINSRLDNHERRISTLETTEKPTLKSDIVNMLVKGLVASIFVIGSLVGAGGILSKIFGS